MAGTGAPRCMRMAWVLLLLPLCRVCSGSDLLHYVVANETEDFVSLPCNASSASLGPHQVTWYRQRNERNSVILQINVTGFMMSSAEFQNRIGFGERWSMLLAAPSLFDSGNYTCEVDGNPPTKAHVQLKIQGLTHSSQEVSEASSTVPSVIDAFIVILLVWIVPVTWLIVFTFQRNGLWIKWFRSLKLPEKVKIGCAFCGLLLSFASLVCLSLYLTMGRPGLYALCGAGLCLGIVGIICLVVPLLLICVCNRFHRTRRTKSQLEGLDDQDGNNRLVSDEREGNQMNDESGTLLGEISGKNKRRTLPKHSSLPKDESLVHSNRGTLPKYGSLPKSIKGTLPKSGEWILPKVRGTLPPDVQDDDDRGDQDSQEDSDDDTVTSESFIIQLDWSETIMEKPSLARINDMIFVPENTLYLCEDHRLYSYTADSNQFDKLLENVEVHFSALTSDDKGTLFILCRSEKEGWHIASIDIKGKERKHRIRFNLPGFPARYNWLTSGHGGLYVTEIKAHQVEIFSKVGKRERWFGEKILRTPTCIVQNNQFQTFVADSKNGDVYVFDKDKKFLSSLGESSPPDVKKRLLGCHKVTITEEGRIFVATATSNVILVFDSNFAPLAWLSVGTESSGPISSIIYANQSLYVAQDDSIHVYSENKRPE
ncbi:uncharacterized protein LOC135468551 [Liolophura sinensis]|uniref:uncharacterized protein LOC135468551 n=1 Tax=Liolophura sinensis TaxID=3198878 RepID=UPI00315989A4